MPWDIDNQCWVDETVERDRPKKGTWWAPLRARPDMYPYLPKWLPSPIYITPIGYIHPKFSSWTHDTLKDFKGRFGKLWRKHLFRYAVGEFVLPYKDNILDEVGDTNCAGYYNGMLFCWVEGNRYIVPIVWGAAQYDHRGAVKTDERGAYRSYSYADSCQAWGIDEVKHPYDNPDAAPQWRVTPSLWKIDGDDRAHFMLAVKDVPTPAPWTVDKKRNIPQWETDREKYSKYYSHGEYGSHYTVYSGYSGYRGYYDGLVALGPEKQKKKEGVEVVDNFDDPRFDVDSWWD